MDVTPIPTTKPATKSRTLAYALAVVTLGVMGHFSPELAAALRPYLPELLVLIGAVIGALRLDTAVPLRWGRSGAHAEAQRRRD